MAEIVYILANEAMPGLVKIGKTNRDELAQRVRELYTSGVPLAFEVFFACEVKNAIFVERNLHDAFDDHRISKKREFFWLAPKRAKAALCLAMVKEVPTGDEIYESADDKKEVEIARRRSRFHLDMLDIPIGTELSLYKEPTVKCITYDTKNRVIYNEQVLTLSRTAKKAFEDLGYKEMELSGPWEWALDDVRLDDRRREIEECSD